jgi:uncharacterized membrane protein
VEDVTARFHLHPVIDHFTIALLAVGVLVDALSSVIAALSGNRPALFGPLSERLRRTALPLLMLGTLCVILSRLTGESDAVRVWETMSPPARGILLSTVGTGQFLSHAVLGTYLMYAFTALAVWRVLLEASTALKRSRIAYLLIGLLAVGALLYQGKTGGELVYDYGVGTSHTQNSMRPAASLSD